MMRKAGFTLIEMLVVVLIVGILSTIVAINYAHVKAKANYNKVVIDFETIKSSALVFKNIYGTWPYDSISNQTIPSDSFITKGLNDVLPSLPSSPCSSKGWIYDWDNWKDLPEYNIDGTVNGARSSYGTIRVTLRDSIVMPTSTVNTSKFYSCIVSDSPEHCAENDRLYAGGGQEISGLSNKAIDCK